MHQQCKCNIALCKLCNNAKALAVQNYTNKEKLQQLFKVCNNTNLFGQTHLTSGNNHSILFADYSLCHTLHNTARIYKIVVCSDIRKTKDTRKHFEKISDDLDNALARNSQAPRNKPQECEEAFNVLTAMKSCFAHTALDYVFQVVI